MSHASGFRRVASLVVFATVLALSGGKGWPETGTDEKSRDCPQGSATVAGADPPDFADICSGVSESLNFLARHGVRPTEPVSIEVGRSMPDRAGPTAAGCYLEEKQRVFVVPYRVFRANETWFGVSIDRELYRVLAAHETAHAVAACNFRIPKPTIQAKEYLAYVVTFSVMSTELRAKALRATATEGFASFDRFTRLLYLVDPMRFGAEAYRHFSAAPDQAALMQDVLDGRVLSE